MNEDHDLFAYSSVSSSTGSLDGSVVYNRDVLLAVQEAQNEQKLNTGKIIRAIMQGVMLMCTVMVLCTLVFYFKPSNCAPYAQSVKYMHGDPSKNTTVNMVVHVHVHVNGTSFVDIPDDECSINDEKIYDMANHDANLLCISPDPLETFFCRFAFLQSRSSWIHISQLPVILSRLVCWR